jgi:hypothetical protein
MAKKKDPLGKLLLSSGNVNEAFLYGGYAVMGLGAVAAVVALFTQPLALVGAAVIVFAGWFATWVGRSRQGRVFEVRTKGVRSVHRGEAVEIRWDEVKRVVVQKSFSGRTRKVMRVTNLDDGTMDYRGEMVMYEFTISGGGEKIVFTCGGPNPSIHPRRLLYKFEEYARAKLQVIEPEDDVYFDD